MTLIVLSMVLPWLFLGLGFWLGYQLLLQNGRIVLRLEALREQFRQLAAVLEDQTQAPTPNGSIAKHLRGKANKGLEYSRINRNGLKAGSPAPDFRLPRLNGGELALEEFRGRSVMLVFSDPECGPCEELAPYLEQFHRHNPDIQVLMISRNDIGINRKKAAALGLTFPIVLQRQWEISMLYGMFATPIAYLIDGQGVLVRDVTPGVEPIRALMARAAELTSRVRQAHADAST
jgi:peroxiredoxin